MNELRHGPLVLRRLDRGFTATEVDVLRPLLEAAAAALAAAHLAETDALTDVANRRRFDAELVREVAAARRHGHELSLLVVDLNRLKAVNDTLGHQAGDDLLRSVAGALSARLRTSDLVARLGGDEFAALLPHTSLEDAEALAQAVADELRDLAGDSFSIGAAVLEEGMSARDLFAAADKRMYAVKRAAAQRTYCLVASKNGW